MLRQLIVFGCLAAWGGCGSSAAAPPAADPIVGSWLAAIGASCSWGFTFEQAAYVEQTAARAGERAELEDDRAPLHPMRIYGELGRVLDRNAIVVGDGGDFVSYAGRLIESDEPGCWLDSGPTRSTRKLTPQRLCAGSGKVARPAASC